jgi:hypothetical protein
MDESEVITAKDSVLEYRGMKFGVTVVVLSKTPCEPTRATVYCFELPVEDLSAPELETEYDGEMKRFEAYHCAWGDWHWSCHWSNALGFVDPDDNSNWNEIIEGFLPSEKGSVWKENEDPEPRKDVHFYGSVITEGYVKCDADVTIDGALVFVDPVLMKAFKKIANFKYGTLQVEDSE